MQTYYDHPTEVDFNLTLKEFANWILLRLKTVETCFSSERWNATSKVILKRRCWITPLKCFTLYPKRCTYYDAATENWKRKG